VILVDTSVLVAVANRRDNNHQIARQLLESTPDELVVAPTVIAEVCYLLDKATGPASEVAFLNSFGRGELELAELTKADVARMAELTHTYADLRLGGTDASLVAIAERLDITQLATFDRRHFSVVRPAHIPAFDLLPA
jgi:predicted nucleic acid-binding protein